MPLSSVIYVHSTFQSIEEFVTSLVPASPASRIRTPGEDVALPTNGTFSRIRSESSNKSSPDMSFLKMFLASYPRQELARWNQETQTWEQPQLDLLGTRQQLSGSFARTGIAVDGMLYPLPTQAHRTSDKGGGVSHGWPTPRESESYQGDGAAQAYMEAGFRQPTHRYDKDGKLVLRSEYGKTGQGTFDTTLTTAVQAHQNWPTPRTRGLLGGSGSREMVRGMVLDGEITEEEAIELLGVTMWPTPVADDTGTRKKKYAQGGTPLSMKVQHWPTPDSSQRGNRASDLQVEGTMQVKRRNSGQRRGMDLETAAHLWPTPTAMEAGKIGNRANYGQIGLSNHPAIVGLPDREKMKKSENDGNNSGVSFRLNPTWVSWLMGLPTGWESLEPMSQEAYDTWFEEMRNGTWWGTERDLPRVTKENNDRVKRLRALGNGIVPASLALFLMGVQDAIH